MIFINLAFRTNRPKSNEEWHRKHWQLVEKAMVETWSRGEGTVHLADITSSTNQHRSTVHPMVVTRLSHFPISRGNETQYCIEVTQPTVKEKPCRQATKGQHPFIPPSDSSPVNNLPNELLSYIFTLGSEAEKSGCDGNHAERLEEGEDVAGSHPVMGHISTSRRARLLTNPGPGLSGPRTIRWSSSSSVPSIQN